MTEQNTQAPAGAPPKTGIPPKTASPQASPQGGGPAKTASPQAPPQGGGPAKTASPQAPPQTGAPARTASPQASPQGGDPAKTASPQTGGPPRTASPQAPPQGGGPAKTGSPQAPSQASPQGGAPPVKSSGGEKKRLGKGISALLGEAGVKVQVDPDPAIPPPPPHLRREGESEEFRQIRSGETYVPNDVDPSVYARRSRARKPIPVQMTPKISGHRKLPIEWIRAGPWQPRREFDQAKLKELAASIHEKGMIQPVIVKQDPKNEEVFHLIAGERRWRAAQIAHVYDIPAMIVDYSNQEAAEIALIENIQRENLSPIDEAIGYGMLIEAQNYTQDELARIVGKSRTHVTNILRLLQLPKIVQSYLSNGRLTVGQARPLVGREDAEELADHIFKHKLNVRDVEELMKGIEADEAGEYVPPPPPKEKPADIKALEAKAQTELGLAVHIEWNEEAETGRLTVKMDSLDQFDGVLRRLGLKEG